MAFVTLLLVVALPQQQTTCKQSNVPQLGGLFVLVAATLLDLLILPVLSIWKQKKLSKPFQITSLLERSVKERRRLTKTAFLVQRCCIN